MSIRSVYFIFVVDFIYSMSFSSFDYKWENIGILSVKKIYISANENIILNIYKKKIRKNLKESITDIITIVKNNFYFWEIKIMYILTINSKN